jgi:hypothetical protein
MPATRGATDRRLGLPGEGTKSPPICMEGRARGGAVMAQSGVVRVDAVWVSMMWFGVRVDLFYAIPIIANWTIEDSVREILLEVNHQMSGRYPPAPGILE